MNVLNMLNPHHLSAAVRQKSPLDIQREIVLQYLLNAVTGFAILGLVFYLARTPIDQSNIALVLPFILTIAFQLLVTVSRRWAYPLRAGLLLVLLASECLAALSSLGMNGTALIYAIALVTVTTVLFNTRAGLIILSTFLVIFATMIWLMLNGRIPIPLIDTANLPTLTSSWINILMAFLLTATSLVVAFHQLTSGLSGALEEQKTLAEQLSKERGQLETRVNERTEELVRKTRQLEAARHVSNAIAAETEYDSLILASVNRIKNQFNLSRVALYLTDADPSALVLKSVSRGEPSNLPILLERYSLDGTETVSRAVTSGEPLFTAGLQSRPDQARARELVVPLKLSDKSAGAVVLHDNGIDNLFALDADIYTTITDQLTLAMEKALLLRRLEQSLKSIEDSYRRSTQKSWNIHLKGSRRKYAYRYSQAQILPEAVHGEESERALQSGSTVIASGTSPSPADQPTTVLAVPIKLRNQTLGVLNMRVNGSRVSPELVALVESAVNRLSISLENARLLEDIQNRADRERLVGEIASKVRSATDIESILRTTAGELGRSLGVTEVVVQLNKLK